MVFLRHWRVGSHAGLAGAQDYPATYIRFYEGTKKMQKFPQRMRTISEIGDNLVADKRNKNGTI
jgi:hypothetical protein